MKAALRLFNAVLVKNKDAIEIDESILCRTLQHGYVLAPAIEPMKKLLKTIEQTIGLSGTEANAAFHKSWRIIEESSIKSLVIQQLTHYFTTYGYEQMGIYHCDAVYIPREKLEVPKLKSDVPVVVVRAMDATELLEAVVELSSGIALAEETLADIMAIVEDNRHHHTFRTPEKFVSRIRNRELATRLVDFFGIVPEEPVEFLRYLISKLTNESLLIKNDELIEKIKAANGKFLDELIKQAPNDLASIFLRYKPLFLAMKTISRNKTFFNRLRKQAKKIHAPLPVDYLNSVTSQITHRQLDLNTLKRFLDKATVFRKIRLADALIHRLNAGGSIVYRVRNGRGWASEFDWPSSASALTEEALECVLDSITENMRENVSGKTFYIPEHIGYALPATEKQFTGHLPTGSYVTVPEDLIVGIHWWNSDKRVDLDLSVIGESGKIGWDAKYRDSKNTVLFSGDITDAPQPDGATELFYIKKDVEEPKILMVNYYNFEKDNQVRTKIIVASESPENFTSNYVVNPNNMIASAEINITKKQSVLGLVTKVNGMNRVYFANISIGNSISSGKNSNSTHARKFLLEKMVNSIDLKMMLERAGATVVNKKPDKEIEDQEFVDLSPTCLDKMTLVRLITQA